MRSVRHLLPLLLLAGAFLGACGDTYQVAVRVGDAELTHAELGDEVEAWSASPELMTQLGVTPAGPDSPPPQQVANEVLNLLVQAELTRIAFGDLLDSPEASATLDAERANVEQSLAPLFGTFPDAVRDATYERIVLVRLGSGSSPANPDVDVYLSPRYGDYDPATGFVEPPEGPTPQPGALTFEL